MGDGLDDDNSRGGEGAFALASVFFSFFQIIQKNSDMYMTPYHVQDSSFVKSYTFLCPVKREQTKSMHTSSIRSSFLFFFL
jgi:hypothetical protein